MFGYIFLLIVFSTVYASDLLEKEPLTNSIKKNYSEQKITLPCFQLQDVIFSNTNYKTLKGSISHLILSLDGGGIRGAFQIKILENIEGEIGQKLYNIFDLIGGTSIGGIHALGLSAGISSEDLENMYLTSAHKIFQPHGYSRGLLSYRYDNSFLKDYFSKKIGSLTMKGLKTNTFVTVYDTERMETTFLESWDQKDQKILISEAGTATAAAPFYFKPESVRFDPSKPIIPEKPISPEEYISAIDGGIGVNNPVMAALSETIKLWGRCINPYLLSIGTGSVQNSLSYNEVTNFGFFAWIPHILDLMLKAQSTAAEKEAKHILGEHRYTRLQANLPKELSSIDNCDSDNIKKLMDKGRELVKSDSFREAISKIRHSSKKFPKKDEISFKKLMKNLKEISSKEKTLIENTTESVRKALEKK